MPTMGMERSVHSSIVTPAGTCQTCWCCQCYCFLWRCSTKQPMMVFGAQCTHVPIPSCCNCGGVSTLIDNRTTIIFEHTNFLLLLDSHLFFVQSFFGFHMIGSPKLENFHLRRPRYRPWKSQQQHVRVQQQRANVGMQSGRTLRSSKHGGDGVQNIGAGSEGRRPQVKQNNFWRNNLWRNVLAFYSACSDIVWCCSVCFLFPHRCSTKIPQGRADTDTIFDEKSQRLLFFGGKKVEEEDR